MHYHALAFDYDGTLATDGHVDDATIDALRRLRESGRRLVLVTGRMVDQLIEVFPQIGLCDLVVADNGAVIYEPQTETRTLLADAPPQEFIYELARRGVPQIEVGDVIVATWVPHETTVLSTIRDLGLELQIIFNKGAVMILPSGVNKATGLLAALNKLGLSRHNTVGVGDAENDEAFLKLCEISAAVDNALDIVKRKVDIVTVGARGAGVTELIELMIENDIKGRIPLTSQVQIGTSAGNQDVRIPVYGTRVLITGAPASGKSNFAITMIEQLTKLDYQVCVIDPEGDYQSLQAPVVLGTLEQVPVVDEVIQVIDDPHKSCVVSLFGAKHEEQPPLFSRVLRVLMDHRSRTGLPHWYLVDEAHYAMPAKWKPVDDLPLKDLRSVMYITAFPEQLPAVILHDVDLFIAAGDEAQASLEAYCELIGTPMPELMPRPDGADYDAIAWCRDDSAPFWMRRQAMDTGHQRHRHGYLDGTMDPEHRFYFRGRVNALNLAAQNLRVFMQIGEGVDDETWLFHLRAGDYSRWFHDVIKDDDLAKQAAECETADMSAASSRAKIVDFIRKKYEATA